MRTTYSEDHVTRMSFNPRSGDERRDLLIDSATARRSGRSSRRDTLLRKLGSESGQSLVLAMIVMSALTISIGALVSFTTGNEKQFSRDRDSARAFHVAEAGVN